MNFLRLLPVILSCLLLGAHFYRAGQVWLTLLCVVLLLLLFLRKPWVPRLFQVALLLGALEWLLTLNRLMGVYAAMDRPWTRMAMILGGVALFTAASGLVFQGKKLKARYLG